MEPMKSLVQQMLGGCDSLCSLCGSRSLARSVALNRSLARSLASLLPSLLLSLSLSLRLGALSLSLFISLCFLGHRGDPLRTQRAPTLLWRLVKMRPQHPAFLQAWSIEC